MNKKILLGLGAILAVVAGIAALSAYEAHVINVTARIENALTVTPESIAFGTVFPQEYVTEELTICTSESFDDESRVDDVIYVIKQKPKPRTEPDRELPVLKPDYNMYLPGGQFEGQLYPHFIDDDAMRAKYCHTHQPADPGDPMDLYYINCYPVLCPWLSKTKAARDSTMPTDRCVDTTWYDCGVPAFHEMSAMAYGEVVKSVDDDCDIWVIDLDVPCFEGQCAQDWTHQGWELPAGLDGEVFGCDLWVEVVGISEYTGYCGDGYVGGEEECEYNEDCEPGYYCEENCTCVPIP